MKTPYDVLGVAPDADDKAIANAFREAAKACHPDVHPENRAAERQFKQITAARDALKDPERRALYRYLQLRRLQERRHWAITIASCTFSALVSAGLVAVLQQEPVPEPPFEATFSRVAMNGDTDIGRPQHAFALAGMEADAARGRDPEAAATADLTEAPAGPREDREKNGEERQDLAALTMAPAPAPSTAEAALPNAVRENSGALPARRSRAAKTCSGNGVGKSQPASERCLESHSGIQPHRGPKARPRIPAMATANRSRLPSSPVGRAASSPPRETRAKPTSIQTPAAESSRPSYAPANECWVDGGGGGWNPCGTSGQ